ncbi:MAG: hypothetical protein ABSA52_09145 [Candidatus Binatia bacterium]
MNQHHSLKRLLVTASTALLLVVSVPSFIEAVCTNDGGTCTYGSSCCSLTCNAGTCCGQSADCPDGAACDSSSQCAGGTCNANTCCGQSADCPDGAACTMASQCAPGLSCQTGTCLPCGGAEEPPCPTATPTPTGTTTPTPTVTPTPTSTPTPTPLALGDACVSSAQCASTFCAPGGVCCNVPCNQPGQSCTLPGKVGLCQAQGTAAPAASPRGLIALGFVLAVLGVVGLRRAVLARR